MKINVKNLFCKILYSDYFLHIKILVFKLNAISSSYSEGFFMVSADQLSKYTNFSLEIIYLKKKHKLYIVKKNFNVFFIP